MSLTSAKRIYKPFEYPWAYEAWGTQQKLHWLPEEVPMGNDVRDWNTKMTAEEKHLITQIFRFFTQADIEVNEAYMDKYSKVFQPTEIKMMLSAFSNMETIHIDAYSHLLDTLGFPESEYSAFLDYEQMRAKHDFLQGFDCTDEESTALTLATYGAFTEGLQLFASFAILLNFPRNNKLNGMGQIVTWSVRDETLHCESIIKLYHTFMRENPQLDKATINEKLVQILNRVIMMEDAFIDLAFEMGDIEGLTKDEVKRYIRYIADIRLSQLGIDRLYSIDRNPLPWLDTILNGAEHTNFFENQATEYSRAATKGSWEDIEW